MTLIICEEEMVKTIVDTSGGWKICENYSRLMLIISYLK